MNHSSYSLLLSLHVCVQWNFAGKIFYGFVFDHQTVCLENVLLHDNMLTKHTVQAHDVFQPACQYLNILLCVHMNRWTSSEWKSNFTTILWPWQEISCPGVCVWRTKLSSSELNVSPCLHSIKQCTLNNLPLLNFDYKQSSRLMTACIIMHHP